MYLEEVLEAVQQPLQRVNAWRPWGQIRVDPSDNQRLFVVWWA
jgi:hypothetical protein